MGTESTTEYGRRKNWPYNTEDKYSLFYYDPTSVEEEEEDGNEPVYFEEALDHQQEGGHGARAGSNHRNLNFNGHGGALNEYNNNNNGYSNMGFNPQNERYGLEMTRVESSHSTILIS